LGAMKNLITLSLAALVALAVSSVAQNDTNQPFHPPGKDGGWDKPHQRKHDKMGDNLPPEEMQRLAAAKEKAKNDPTVRSLQEARTAIDTQLENAMRAAMMAADPTLGPVLDKIKEARARAKGMRDRFESLTPEQKESLKAARESVKNDPAVQAAREKIRAAQGPEAKKDATRELLQATKAAVLKQNPELEPLLDRLGPPRHDRMPPPSAQVGGPSSDNPMEEPAME